MRVVRTPDGGVSPDPGGRLAGRGAYVCRSVGCLDKAIAKGALARALRIQLPTDLRASLADSITDQTVEGGPSGQE